MDDRAERMRHVPVGTEVSFGKTITEAEVHILSALLGDVAGMLGPDAPILLVMSWISGLLARLAERVPLPGAVSYRYDFHVVGQAGVGDTLQCRAQVKGHVASRGEIIVEVSSVRQDGVEVLRGTAVLKVLRSL